MGLVQILLVVLMVITNAEETILPTSTNPLPRSDCLKKCGTTIIEYPFGIGEGCFFRADFNLTCKNISSYSSEKLFLGDSTIEIKEINTKKGVLIIKSSIITMDVSKKYESGSFIDFKDEPFSFFIHTRDSYGDFTEVAYNRLYVTGCSASMNLVDISANISYSSCLSMCATNASRQNGWNYDNGYCEIEPEDLSVLNLASMEIQLTRLSNHQLINTSIVKAFLYDEYNITTKEEFQELKKGNITEATASLVWYIKDNNSCKEAKKNTKTHACVSKNSECYEAFPFYSTDLNNSVGYLCLCYQNYYGNPYVRDGCKGKNFTLHPDKECETKCGSMNVSFPFGLEKDCYRDESFHLHCNRTTKPPTLSYGYYTSHVDNILMEDGQLIISYQDTFNSRIDKTRIFNYIGEQSIYNWVIEHSSCEEAKKASETYACFANHSECTETKNFSHGEYIFGYRCKCAEGYQGNPYIVDGCTDIDECSDPKRYVCYGDCKNVEGNYICTCPVGSSGNPKEKACVPNSKRSTLLLGIIAGISSGMSLLILCGIFFIIRIKFRRRHHKKMRERYFHQNHGLLLKQLISSGEDNAERTKIFSLEEIEKATNNFDKTRVLGRGGHGTVYKGILSDQRVVAIKKSKIVKKSEIDQFINEVAILSQVNHRNIVRLFGCCLETQVPLLIYEFISNGALSDHLHVAIGSSALSWKDRLRIATEAAGALAYLHSAASISILHRDIKSSNILLDDNFTAKVSDFGASRFIPLDQTHVITAIQGTFGYLDPEYYQTSQLTQKSDVYGFGVILLELLTGKKPIYTTEDEQNLNLSMHFLQAVRANRSFELVDDCVMEEIDKEELKEIVQLIQMCLKLKGTDRPTMKEIEYKLQSFGTIRIKKRGQLISEGEEERQYLLDASACSEGTSRNYSMEKEVI